MPHLDNLLVTNRRSRLNDMAGITVVSFALIAVGLPVLVYGLAVETWWVAALGVVLVSVGIVASGAPQGQARSADQGASTNQADADRPPRDAPQTHRRARSRF